MLPPAALESAPALPCAAASEKNKQALLPDHHQEFDHLARRLAPCRCGGGFVAGADVADDLGREAQDEPLLRRETVSLDIVTPKGVDQLVGGADGAGDRSVGDDFLQELIGNRRCSFVSGAEIITTRRPEAILIKCAAQLAESSSTRSRR
jgi:hypothetical protein